MRTDTANVIAGVVCAAIAGGLGLTAKCGEPGSGVSVGTVVNTAHEGFLWPRPVIYLLHAGEMKADDMALASDALEQRARMFAASGERVKVHYQEYLACWRWNYRNCLVVDAIEPDTERK